MQRIANGVQRGRDGRGVRGVARLLAVLGLLAVAAGCESTLEPPGTTPPPVAEVELDSEGLDLLVGGYSTVTVILRAADGRPILNRPISWTASDQAVARVSAAGVVTAVGPGRATIRATSEGKSAALVLTVHEELMPVGSVQVEPLGPIDLTVGSTLELRAIVRAVDGTELHDRPVAWISFAETVATVSATGVVTAQGVGQAVIGASSGGRAGAVTIRVVEQAAESYGYDLIFDSATGTLLFPELFRVSLGDGAAHPVRILDYGGAFQATASPDGTRIAYTCVHSHRTAICAANADGTNAVVLTPGTDLADQPAWSPDGTMIAFRRWAAGGPPGRFNPSRIWVMNADGSGQRTVTDPGPDGWHETPTWSPVQTGGGFRIAFSAQVISGGYRVGRIRSVRDDGMDDRPVSSGTNLESDPAWSPGGESIVFVRTGGTAFSDLWMVDVQTGLERPLFETPLSDQKTPAWSPDGRYIAFTSMHEVAADGRWAFHLYTIRPDGTELTRRTSFGTDRENPAWIARR